MVKIIIPFLMKKRKNNKTFMGIKLEIMKKILVLIIVFC